MFLPQDFMICRIHFRTTQLRPIKSTQNETKSISAASAANTIIFARRQGNGAPHHPRTPVRFLAVWRK
jgi:hypothetical protein